MAIKTLIPPSAGQHAAPATYFSQLLSAISGVDFQGHDVYINEYGENLPPNMSPYTVANLVKAGAIWVDWCGYPMYGYNGSTSFQDFVNTLGLSLGQFTFITGGTFGPLYAGGYDRSLDVTNSNPVGNPNFVKNPNAWSTVATNRVNTFYVFSSFALLSGKGAYIYAFGNNGQSWGGYPAGSDGIVPNQLTPFITQTILPMLGSMSTSTGGYTGGTSSGGSGSGSTGGTGGTTTSGVPNCSGIGTYVGTGTAAGVSPGLYVFTKIANNIKTNTVVDSNCNVKAIYTFQWDGSKWVSTTPAGTTGGTTTSGSGSSTTSSTPKAQNTTIYLLAAGAVALVLGYQYMKHRL